MPSGHHSALIRAAQPADVPLLLHFIQQLALAEDFPGPVVVTEVDLQRRLFGAEQLAEAVIVECEQRPVGFAVFYQTFSTTTGKAGLHLDDVYLEPAMQGRGLGKQVFAWLAAEALRRDCARLEWWSLRWNEQANAFYGRIHASVREELQIYRLDRDAMQRLTEHS
ncbi:GNAT family N-acetyltransferase [Permianibacter sp. IMCC34836]|uniref:GNAT family N-acetyltransferase n=1 Tax=Permianibacter fluminis TaxID=2738515 RepID=UPI0015569606|nr:GNAT family N-acetyltransferase [Permianibacter fluminis]NQD37583.1 GNAT family N-acetyltransferase [Permianibacter fluminis]